MAVLFIIHAQIPQHRIQQSERPLLFKGLFGSVVVGRFTGIAGLGGVPRERQRMQVAGPLLSVCLAPFNHEKPFQHEQHERPKPSARLVGVSNPVLLQQPGEECLGKVLRVVDGVTTHWSVVLAATRSDTTRAQAALEHLCRIYWYPIYHFVRREGHSTHDAQDLTQEFFARLLEKHWIADADQSRGRFRSFMLLMLKRFLVGE